MMELKIRLDKEDIIILDNDIFPKPDDDIGIGLLGDLNEFFKILFKEMIARLKFEVINKGEITDNFNRRLDFLKNLIAIEFKELSRLNSYFIENDDEEDILRYLTTIAKVHTGLY